MTTTEFWKIIEKTKRGTESDDEQAEKLEELLAKLPPEEIVSFENIFTGFRYAAYRWDLWGVAYILCGGCGDDSFDYFRAWLIGRGQKFYEDAMKEPESVARKVTKDDFPDGESLMNAAAKAYEGKTGHDLPAGSIKHLKDLAGKNGLRRICQNYSPSLPGKKVFADDWPMAEPGCGRSNSNVSALPANPARTSAPPQHPGSAETLVLG